MVEQWIVPVEHREIEAIPVILGQSFLGQAKEPLFFVSHMLPIVLGELPHHLSRVLLRGLRLLAHTTHCLGECLSELVKPAVLCEQITQPRARVWIAFAQ